VARILPIASINFGGEETCQLHRQEYRIGHDLGDQSAGRNQSWLSVPHRANAPFLRDLAVDLASIV